MDNVSSLSSNVQVEDSGILWNITWAVLNVEDVRSVLEGSSVLGGVNGKEEVESFNLHDVVLVNRGLGCVALPVNELLVGSVSILSKISSGNVVSDSENTVTVVSLDAGFFGFGWDGPVKEVVVNTISVSKVVFSGDRGSLAGRGWDSPRINLLPFLSSGSFAFSLGNWGSNVSVGIDALESVLLVLGLILVETAPVSVVGEDGNISPWGWGPIWVVVSLLRAFITMSVSVVVLSGESGGSSSVVKSTFGFSVGDEETLVSVSGLAGLVPFVWLVHSKFIVVSVHGSWSVRVIRDGIGGGSISDLVESISILVLAHVLDDNVAVHSWVGSTSVLSSPFNGKTRSSVVSQSRTPAVSSLCVVLGVK